QQEAATRKLANPDASFAEMREAVEAVATELQALTGPVEAPALAAALADMGHADFAAADRLLAAVESRGEGKAAYARAIIAGIDYRLADARRLFERAAQLDPDTDKRLVNAAMACGATGDFQSAARWADQALARAQRRGDRLETVRAATCLGVALQGVGDFQRAGAAHQLAFDHAVTLDEDSNEFLAAHSNLGLFLLTMVDPRSEQLLRRVVDVTERRRGRDTPSYATAIGNYACVCRLTNRWDEAERLFEMARDIFAAKLGRRSPAYTRQLAQLGMTRAMRMPFAGADQMVVEALEIDREVLGQQHPEYGAKLAMLGGLRVGQQRFAEAESLFRQALAIAERTFGPNHPETAGSRFGLANALAMQQRLPEALPLLEHAEQVFRTSYGPQHPQTQQAGMALNQVRTMIGPTNPMERIFPSWFVRRS
ncbi:MAG: tetratricopeptide repeat protein, partial [Geminicoccaceae bacterium]